MDTKQLDRLYALYRKYDMTPEDWLEWDTMEVNEEHDAFDILYSEILRLREASAKKDAMIYRMAEMYFGRFMSSNDVPTWVLCLTNCTDPTDPVMLAETVKAAMSLEDYHAES